MLLVLVLKPLDVRAEIFVVGVACRCVESCYGGELWRVGVSGVYIRVMVTLCLC